MKCTLIGLLLLFSVALSAVADTHYVWPDSPAPSAPYTNWLTAADTIQLAVNAATTGDVVQVTNGVFIAVPSIDIPFDLTLRGNGSGQTVIDALFSNRCLVATAPGGVVIEGFTITRGMTDGNDGAGLSCHGGTLVDCVFSNNALDDWGWGAAIYQDTGVLEMRDCIVVTNMNHPIDPFLGAVKKSAGHLLLDNCLIAMNNGTGVEASGGSVEITNSVIRNNAYGGVSASGGATSAANSSFLRNGASGVIGGLSSEDSTIRNCTFAENLLGGFQAKGALFMDSCTVLSNSSRLSGAGILVYYSAVISNSTIAYNVSGQSSGGVGVSASADLRMVNCTMLSNRTTGASVYGGGAMFVMNGPTVALENCTISGNSAGYRGGGLRAIAGLSLTHCTVTGNTAGDRGGGIEGATVLSNSVVSGNTAPTGPDCSDIMSIRGNCLIGNATGCSFSISPGATIVTNVDANLAPLATISGPSATHAPRWGSPVIDQCASSSTSTDQRGCPRPMDGNCDGEALADIGAFEFDPTTTDSDGDGATDYAECMADTAPTNSSSSLAVTGAMLSGSDMLVAWNGGVMATQLLECCANLAEEPQSWQVLLTNTPPTVSNTFLHPTTDDVLFYRIRIP